MSHPSRILNQARALEILLKIPQERQRKHLKERIANLADLPGEEAVSYWTTYAGKKKVRETGSRKMKWADRIYLLRNKIIHGEEVVGEDFNFEGAQRHLDIVPMFFMLALRKELNRFLRREEYFDQIAWRNGPGQLRGFEYDFRDMHAAYCRSIRAARGKVSDS